jgi:hypothetical protein
MFDPSESESEPDDPMAMAKRRVEVCVGIPEMLSGMEMTQTPGIAHPDECYFINFVDLPSDDDDGLSRSGFTAQSTCLCTLSAATTAWLQGASEEEVQAVMERHTGEKH